MSCCGNRYAGPQARSISPESRTSPAPAGVPADPLFEYVGGTSLTVAGPVTGRRYHFEVKGARRSISRHDAPSLLHIPNLRHIAQR
jgi:hypothetical protein